MRRFVRERWLALCVIAGALSAMVLYMWAEWGYFRDQAKSHGDPVPTEYFSSSHLHDLIYNAAANWQSELLFGVLLVWLLHKADADA